MCHALTLDATALQALENVHTKALKRGTLLLLSGVHAQPLMVMERSGFLERIGQENVFADIDAALNRSREALGLPTAAAPGTFVPTLTREMMDPGITS